MKFNSIKLLNYFDEMHSFCVILELFKIRIQNSFGKFQIKKQKSLYIMYIWGNEFLLIDKKEFGTVKVQLFKFHT